MQLFVFCVLGTKLGYQVYTEERKEVLPDT